MVSPERLRRVAALGVRLASARRAQLVAQLLLAGGLVFVALRLRSTWHNSHVALGHAAWAPLLGAAALDFAPTTASAFIWLAILTWLGVRPRPAWAGMFFQAQLGKYIPGTVWPHAGRTALARTHGIALRPVAVSLPIEFAGSVFGAVFFSAFLD
jgi:hypothetical protein